MQAPKDGDEIVFDPKPRDVYEKMLTFTRAAAELKAMQYDRKRLDEPQPLAGKGVSFVTGNCSQGDPVIRDAFTRGFVKGLQPLNVDNVRVDSSVNADVGTYSMCGVSVQVSGLELLVAADPEALGHDRGEALRRLVLGEGERFTQRHDTVLAAPWTIEHALVREWRRVLDDPAMHLRFHGRLISDCLAELVPEVVAAALEVPAAPQLAAWSGASQPEGAYGMLRVNLPDGRREVCYVRSDVLSEAECERLGLA